MYFSKVHDLMRSEPPRVRDFRDVITPPRDAEICVMRETSNGWKSGVPFHGGLGRARCDRVICPSVVKTNINDDPGGDPGRCWGFLACCESITRAILGDSDAMPGTEILRQAMVEGALQSLSDEGGHLASRDRPRADASASIFKLESHCCRGWASRPTSSLTCSASHG